MRPDHPLRAIRAMADLALWRLSGRFAAMYERLLMEEICASSTAIKRRRKLRAQSCNWPLAGSMCRKPAELSELYS